MTLRPHGFSSFGPSHLHRPKHGRYVSRRSRSYGAGGEEQAPSPPSSTPMECAMPQANDLSRSLVSFDHNATLVAVIELSKTSWLIAGTVPGIERQPLKKIAPDEAALLRVLHRWRDEAVRSCHTITRIAVAFEAGRDGLWLARWLVAHGIDAHVIHPTSVALSRE